MRIRLDASKSWIEGSLASHTETARLGLVECSLATWSQRWTCGVWPRSHRLHHTLTVHQYHQAFDPLHVDRLDTNIIIIIIINVSTTNLSVRSGKLFQTAQTVFLPHPRNEEVLSHPVRLWNRSTAMDLDGPIPAWSEWTGMSRYFFPVPKPTHSYDSPSVSKNRSAKTTMSLSTVRTYALLWPCTAALAICRSIRVSASAWLHGWSPDTSKFLLVSTPSK